MGGTVETGKLIGEAFWRGRLRPSWFVLISAAGVSVATLSLYWVRVWLVSVRGISTEGQVAQGSRVIEGHEGIYFLLASVLLIFLLVVLVGTLGQLVCNQLWSRWPMVHRSVRSGFSTSHMPLAIAVVICLTLSLVMLRMQIGITVPLPGPSYPFRIETILYFLRLGVAPVLLSVVAARSQARPLFVFLSILIVGVVASATSASRLTALMYALVLLVVSWKRVWPRFAGAALALIVFVNVATRSRTILIPQLLDSALLKQVYATPESMTAALNISPAETLGRNVVDFAGSRALGLDELNLALATRYPDISFSQGLAGLAQTFGVRTEVPTQCPQIAGAFAADSDRFGGMNLDPIGRLWQASCGQSGAYLIGLFAVASVFALLILGALALRVRWGHLSPALVVMLGGYVLWFDSRYTVLRFCIVILILAVMVDFRVSCQSKGASKRSCDTKSSEARPP